MNLLETNKQVLMWLCGIPPKEFDKKWKNIPYIILTASVIMVHSLAVISSAVFIYKNVSVSLEETLFSLFHNVGNSSTLYQSIAIILLKKKLTEIFESLSKIYDQSKTMNSKHFVNKSMHIT